MSPHHPKPDASTPSHWLDKPRVRATFQRAASSCDTAARVQQEVAARLLEHLDPVRLEPVVILDVGAGTGDLAKSLSRRFPGASVVAVDIAEAMLNVARSKAPWLFSRQRFLCGDAEALPIKDSSVDLIVCNATLQWCNQLEQAITGFFRVLKPGGLLMLSTFGPDTLDELRQSWAKVDEFAHVHPFADMHDLGDALVRGGFSDVVMDCARLTAEYESVVELMRELKSLGATNSLAARRRAMTGRGRLERLRDAYEVHRRNGALPATFEAVFAHAWKPEAGSTVSVTLGLLPK
jgi:malonyl-CoA O-methyltransferase